MPGAAILSVGPCKEKETAREQQGVGGQMTKLREFEYLSPGARKVRLEAGSPMTDKFLLSELAAP